MDKLAGYGSDDDYSDSPKHRKTEQALPYDWRNNQHNQHNQQPHSRQHTTRQVDVNYEEVQMELSEDSNSDSSKGDVQARGDRSNKSSRTTTSDRRDREDDRYSRDSPKYRDYRPRRDEEEEDRYRNRDDNRDRYRRNRDDNKYKEKYNRDDRSRNYRGRRSSSRERRSRSPRKSDRTKRSNSKDRDSKYVNRRYERNTNKLPVEKAELNKPIEQPEHKTEPDKDRFYMPGITGRFKEQIERRKLLWQKKDAPKREVAPPVPTTAGKVWQTTTFAQDTDGKVASKFKRLMGIRESTEGPKGTTDVLKKQEEMFSSMEQQYEVARTATHTMRGVGLGFGSFQR